MPTEKAPCFVKGCPRPANYGFIVAGTSQGMPNRIMCCPVHDPWARVQAGMQALAPADISYAEERAAHNAAGIPWLPPQFRDPPGPVVRRETVTVAETKPKGKGK